MAKDMRPPAQSPGIHGAAAGRSLYEVLPSVAGERAHLIQAKTCYKCRGECSLCVCRISQQLLEICVYIIQHSIFLCTAASLLSTDTHNRQIFFCLLFLCDGKVIIRIVNFCIVLFYLRSLRKKCFLKDKIKKYDKTDC